MQLVREHINEKFTQDSDPIEDMGIGLKPLIEKWLNDLNNNTTHNNIIINNNGSIDVDSDLDISYDFIKTLPYYIKFNKIKGNFSCCLDKKSIQNSGPKYVYGYYGVWVKNIHDVKNNPTEKFIRKTCKITGGVFIYQAY